MTEPIPQSTVTPHSPVVRATGLTKRFGDRVAVDGLSFELPAGAVTGFVGPNGAGKTTTIRLLLGLARPSSGTAEVLGHPVTDPAAYLGKVGALIEGPAFHPGLSGRDNLISLARLGGLPDRRAGVVLDQVGLAGRAGDLYRSYSLGMKQRLGIAAALLPDPELLILDEPTNGLDPAGIREVRALLRGLADGGTTVLVSSHLLDELQHVCDHLVMISAGRSVYQGPVADLLDAAGPEVRAVPEQAADVPALVALCGRAGYCARIAGDAVLVAAPPAWAAELNRRAMTAGITLSALGTREARLEEAFFNLTTEVSKS